MCPLEIEAYVQEAKQWTKVGVVNPGDPSGSLSRVNEDATRDIIMFECNNDDVSTIYKSTGGIDTELGAFRATTIECLEPLRLVHKGGDPFEMTVKTDRSPVPIRVRFTQK